MTQLTVPSAERRPRVDSKLALAFPTPLATDYEFNDFITILGTCSSHYFLNCHCERIGKTSIQLSSVIQKILRSNQSNVRDTESDKIGVSAPRHTRVNKYTPMQRRELLKKVVVYYLKFTTKVWTKLSGPACEGVLYMPNSG